MDKIMPLPSKKVEETKLKNRVSKEFWIYERITEAG